MKTKKFKWLKEIKLDMLFVLILGFIILQFNLSDSKPKPKNQGRENFPNIFSEEVYEFNFINYPPVKEVNDSKLGIVLSDIESHLMNGHPYKDSNLITWGHESTHGINANIRNSQPESYKINAFYCLKDRAVVLYEPKTTITKVANKIPQVLRGPSYNLYLKDQAKYWNDKPLYLLDEWVAYTNGTEVGRELKAQGWDYELMQAHNFNVYVICLAKEIKANCPDYDDIKFCDFLKWNIERVMNLTEDEGNQFQKDLKRSKDYLNIFQTHAGAQDLRSFCRDYFGDEWCQRILNI